MKIIFVDIYPEHSSPHKDPVTTPLILKELGHDVLLVSCTKTVSKPFVLAGLPVVHASEMRDGGWRRHETDAAVVISRFSPALTPLLCEIKDAQIPLVVKGDTDGTIGYPLKPNYLRLKPLSEHPANILRHLKWRLPTRYWVGQKAAHVQIADRVVVESPGAAANLSTVLRYWKRVHDIAKIQFIPNQVSQTVLEKPIEMDKEKIVLSIGRWDDALCKGSDILARVAIEFAAIRKDYTMVFVGAGLEQIRRRLPTSVAARILFIDKLPFEALQEQVRRARILLVPSRLESFSLVTAEALCSGASIVATPIESLTYLAGGGAWGTLSRDFSPAALASALLYEVELWEAGVRKPSEIAGYWRKILAPQTIGQAWSETLHQLVAGSRATVVR